MLISYKKQASVCHLIELNAVMHCSYAQRYYKCPECKCEVVELSPSGSTFFMSQEIENSDFGIDLVMGGTLSFVEGCPLKSRRLHAI